MITSVLSGVQCQNANPGYQLALNAGAVLAASQSDDISQPLPTSQDTLSAASSGYHTVYNFEVAGTHTYIADGVRVHNTSVLSFLKGHELVNADWSTLEDTTGDGSFDYIEVDSELNGYKAGSTIYKVRDDNGQLIAEGFQTFTDENGKLMQLQTVRYPNGDVKEVKRVELTGAAFGEAAGQLVTPFLTGAILGEDANAFEEIAVNTILGTFVGNIFEFAGGNIHDQIVSGGRQNNGFEAIADHTFSDILGDLGSNAVLYTSTALTSWIMAEVFDWTASDNLSGDVLTTLASQGVNYLVDATLFEFGNALGITDVQLNGLGLAEFNLADIDQIFSVPQLGNVLFTAAFNRVLPEIETVEGHLANGAVNLAIAHFNLIPGITALGGFNPVGFLIAHVVGKLFDSLFEKTPEAYTNVLFNEETGQFYVGNSWSDDGGDSSIGRQMADRYVEFMNALMDQSQATSSNLADLPSQLKLVFGHYEEHIRNGADRNFDSLDLAVQSRIIDSIQKLELHDGDLKVKSALDDAALFADMLDNIHFTGSYSYWKKFLFFKIKKKYVYTEINEDPESTNDQLISFVSGFKDIGNDDIKAGIVSALSNVYTNRSVSSLADQAGVLSIVDKLTSKSWATNVSDVSAYGSK